METEEHSAFQSLKLEWTCDDKFNSPIKKLTKAHNSWNSVKLHSSGVSPIPTCVGCVSISPTPDHSTADTADLTQSVTHQTVPPQSNRGQNSRISIQFEKRTKKSWRTQNLIHGGWLPSNFQWLPIIFNNQIALNKFDCRYRSFLFNNLTWENKAPHGMWSIAVPLRRPHHTIP